MLNVGKTVRVQVDPDTAPVNSWPACVITGIPSIGAEIGGPSQKRLCVCPFMIAMELLEPMLIVVPEMVMAGPPAYAVVPEFSTNPPIELAVIVVDGKVRSWGLVFPLVVMKRVLRPPEDVICGIGPTFDFVPLGPGQVFVEELCATAEGELVEADWRVIGGLVVLAVKNCTVILETVASGVDVVDCGSPSEIIDPALPLPGVDTVIDIGGVVVAV